MHKVLQMGSFPIVHCRKHDSGNFVSVSQKRKHREKNSGESESEEERDAASFTCTFVPQAESSLSPRGNLNLKSAAIMTLASGSEDLLL